MNNRLVTRTPLQRWKSIDLYDNKTSILLYIVHCSQMVFKTHMTIKKTNEITKPERDSIENSWDPVLLNVFSVVFWKWLEKTTPLEINLYRAFKCAKWIGFLNIYQLSTLDIFKLMFLNEDKQQVHILHDNILA